MVFWHGITGVPRRCGGLWGFLITWAKGRTAVELERERNRATAEALQLLPHNCELLEYERDGRLRMIRKSGPSTTAPTVTGETLPRLNGELDR
jgi:hypothetical protein